MLFKYGYTNYCYYRLFKFLLILSVVVFYSSCALTNKELTEKHITTAYQKVYLVDNHYKRIMTAASEAYKDGLLPREAKQAIISQGKKVYEYQYKATDKLLILRKRADAGVSIDASEFVEIEKLIYLSEKELVLLHDLVASWGVLYDSK